MPRKKDVNSGDPKRNPYGGSSTVVPTKRRNNFQKLRRLDCFAEVHDRMCKGYPITELARYVQEDCKEYTDVTNESLVRILYNYRASLPKAELAKYTLSKDHQAALDTLDEDLDEITEFTRLYKMQMNRINIDLNTEKKIGKLFNTMNQEIRVAGELLNRVSQLKMDLGINNRHLGTLDVEADVISELSDQYEGTAVGKVINDPKSRRKLTDVAEHVLSLVGRGVDFRDLGLSENDDDNK